MRNKIISKILIAAGLVTVVGAGAYGTSQSTNYGVAANKALAQGKNAFEGLMMSLDDGQAGEKTTVSGSTGAASNSTLLSNGISSGAAENADNAAVASLDDNVLEENIFGCNNSDDSVAETAMFNLAKDDKTSVMQKLYLTNGTKRPVKLQWVNCIKDTITKPNNNCNNGTNSGNTNNNNNNNSNSGLNTENGTNQDTQDKNDTNNNTGNDNNSSNNGNDVNSGNDSNTNNNTNNNGNNNNNNNNNTNDNTTQNKPSTDNNAGSESNYIAEIEQLIFNKVNAERTAAGLSPLSYNNTMQKYARIKSKDMGDRKYFDHKNPEGQLITVQMQNDGVKYSAWGENIAYIGGMSGNSTLADKFMTNWMNSSGHRANILSTNFSSIGVGVYKIGNTYYATQEFYR